MVKKQNSEGLGLTKGGSWRMANEPYSRESNYQTNSAQHER